MTELLIEDISKTISLSPDDAKFVESLFKPKKLRRKQYFLQEGNIAFYTAWVARGCLRTYSVNRNGVEQTMQLAIEGWWATDIYSFLTGEPAMYNIEAVEDCDLLIIDKIGRELLFEKVPAFERLMRILIEKNLVANQQRLNALMGQNADERYEAFLKKYPKIAQRVPQHMIASYLGISPETLSRIRKQKTG